jgi:hypothetical protein
MDKIPTYDEIKDKVYLDTGLKISRSCYIAEVLRAYGLTRRTSWNSGKGKGSPQCPEKQYKAIESVLKEFGVVK